MIIVLRPDVDQEQAESLRCFIRDHDLEVQTIIGTHQTVLGVVGDSSVIDTDFIGSLDIVESVKKVTVDHRLAGRISHPADSVFQIGSDKIGGGHFGLIVCDGAEQASEPRYQDLIRYFDGLRVGLVSCAEDAEQPAVRALFSGDAGTPDFIYSFEQAVEDGYLADFLTVASPLKFIPPVSEGIRKPSPASKNGSGKKQSSASVSPA